MRAAIVALAVALLGVTASSASADEVWLWACHGPGGEALSAPTGSRATPAGGSENCAEAAGALRASGGQSWAFTLPTGLALQQVRIFRSVAVGEGSYRLSAADATLETAAAGTERTFPASGSRVAFEVACPVACAGASVSAIGFQVSDTEAPTGSVGGVRSPAEGKLALEVTARDQGIGLRNAVVFVDGQPAGGASFGDPGCVDVSPGSPGVDLPFGLIGQNDAGLPPLPVGCVGRGTVSLSLDTTALTNGDRRVSVLVSDLAGNVSTALEQMIEVDNPLPPVPATVNRTTNTPPTPSTDLAGVQATPCVGPRLVVDLADKPARREKGVAVLLSGGRYKFTGRLTCRSATGRRAAPKRAILDVFSRVGRRVQEDFGTTTAPDGFVSTILSFYQSRTLVFRFTSAEGNVDEVAIPIIVDKARPFPRKAAIHAVWLRFETPSDRVRFSSLEARRVIKGATVTITCSGDGCPAARRTVRSGRNRDAIPLLGVFGSGSLRPGAVVDVTITKPGYIGVGKVYCVRDGQRVQTLPYRVGNTRPSCG